MTLLVLAPAGAQSRKVVKQAKEDAKLELQALKDKGFKALDNVKIDDAIIVSVIATGFDLPKPELIETDGPAETKSPVNTRPAAPADEEPDISFNADDDDNVIPGFFRRG